MTLLTSDPILSECIWIYRAVLCTQHTCLSPDISRFIYRVLKTWKRIVTKYVLCEYIPSPLTGPDIRINTGTLQISRMWKAKHIYSMKNEELILFQAFKLKEDVSRTQDRWIYSHKESASPPSPSSKLRSQFKGLMQVNLPACCKYICMSQTAGGWD